MTRRPAHLARERALYLYASALQRGDLAAMQHILTLAQDDPVLEREIDELEEHDTAGLPELALLADAVQVQALLKRHLPSAYEAIPEVPAPLTVGDVVGKMVLEQKVPGDDLPVAARLRDHQAAVPPRLGRKDVLRLAQDLGIRASERFWQLFREAALLLGLRHSQHAGLAAARRREPKTPGDKEQP